MHAYKLKKAEMDFLDSVNRSFQKPVDCTNADQIRSYVRELCLKIEEYEDTYHYVPDWAYSLLAQYNNVYTRMVSSQFSQIYL